MPPDKANETFKHKLSLLGRQARAFIFDTYTPEIALQFRPQPHHPAFRRCIQSISEQIKEHLPKQPLLKRNLAFTGVHLHEVFALVFREHNGVLLKILKKL